MYSMRTAHLLKMQKYAPIVERNNHHLKARLVALL